MPAIEIANLVQAMFTLAASSDTDFSLISSAGVASLRRDGVGEWSVLLEQPVEVRIVPVPAEYRVQVLVSQMTPGVSEARALPIPVDATPSPTNTPGSIKVFSYDAAGAASDIVFCNVIVLGYPRQN